MLYIKLDKRHPVFIVGQWLSWEDRSVCVEVFLHIQIGEDLCEDCRNLWNAWTDEQRRTALMTGRHEYERYLMEDVP